MDGSSLSRAPAADAFKAPLLAKPQKAFAIAFVVMATVLAGCASGLGVNSSERAPIGHVARVEEGTIINVRETGETGHAYTIRLRSSELVSVAQSSESAIALGTPVVIEFGASARVIPQGAV